VHVLNAHKAWLCVVSRLQERQTFPRASGTLAAAIHVEHLLATLGAQQANRFVLLTLPAGHLPHSAWAYFVVQWPVGHAMQVCWLCAGWYLPGGQELHIGTRTTITSPLLRRPSGFNKWYLYLPGMQIVLESAV
jgi:hypothetical protein